MSELAVLIPLHNNLSHTRTCLSVLFKQKNALAENKVHIIVIDDGSTDGSYEWISENYPEVFLIKGDGNLWWSGAINLGAKFAINELKVEYLLLWNNDIVFRPDYFSNLFKTLKNVSHDVIIGSKILVRESPEMVWSMGGIFNSRNGLLYMKGFFKPDGSEFQSPQKADWLTGMGTIIHKNVIDKIGYWNNKDFPQYQADCEFTYRAKQNGFQILVLPDLILYNNVESSGLEHSGSFRLLIKSLTDLRSKYNIKSLTKFYRIYATSPLAFVKLYAFYMRLFAGFFKWKFLSLLGIKKKKYWHK